MSKTVKWLLYGLGGVVVVLVGLVIAARVMVGSVNPTLGEVVLDSSKLEERIRLPDGFTMGVYAANIPRARLLRFTHTGDLLVAVPNDNKVILLERDNDGDGKANGARTLLRDVNGPNGLDFHGGFLYVAEQDAIGRVPFDHDKGELTGTYERIVTGLPGGENHWKKTLRVGPDNLLYVTMGSSCNVCIETDERRASMVRYNLDGSGETIFARGLRNSAGFDWRPADGLIYATDNGRDSLGDNFPPCELNRVEQGQHYGWPYANGDKVPDPDFGAGHEDIVASSMAPVFGFRAHNAPLGIEFVRNNNFPPEYQDAAIVALHGSWNRSEKDGYKVVSVHFGADGSVTERDFVTGFLVDGDVIGRPAEVTQGPDGAFYIADDYAGAVYRVAYGGAPQSLAMPEITLREFDKEKTLAALAPEERARLKSVGDKIFHQDPCLGCHVPEGQGLGKKLENLGSKYDIRTLSTYLAKPTPPMPLYPYTDDDRRALSVYLIEMY